jgi:hypothetical protein
MRSKPYVWMMLAYAAACIVLSATARATEVVISPPMDDSRIDSAFPNTNYNYFPEDSKLLARHSYIGPSDTFSLLKFDLSAIPDSATIIQATLNLLCLNMSSESVIALRMGYDGWTEDDVTWNSYAAYLGGSLTLDSKLVQVINYDPAYWEEWDLSSLNWQDDLNDNLLTLMLRAPADSLNYGSPAQMASKEYRDPNGVAYEPYLRIEYVPEPAGLALLVLCGAVAIRRGWGRSAPDAG